MLRLLALYPLSLVVSVFATTANATTYQINAAYSTLPSSVTGSFTMDNKDPSTIANVNIDAILPLGFSTFEITFDQVINPTLTWPIGYLWFANSQYSAGSTHFFMFLTGSTDTNFSIGMGFNAHQSEIAVFNVGGWQPIFGEMTAASVPSPVVGAGLPGLIRLRWRWPSRLVATAAEDRLIRFPGLLVSHATALAKGLALILHVTPDNDVSSC
jgi:hypothetical protein